MTDAGERRVLSIFDLTRAVRIQVDVNYTRQRRSHVEQHHVAEPALPKVSDAVILGICSTSILARTPHPALSRRLHPCQPMLAFHRARFLDGAM